MSDELPHGGGAPFRHIGAESAAALMGAVVTGADATQAVAAGAVPFFVRATHLAVQELRAEGRRVNEMAESAIEAADGDIERLLSAAEAGEARQGLLIEAINESAFNRYSPAVRAIGKALRDRLLGDGTLDHEQQVIQALGAIARPHVVVMWALRAESDVPSGPDAAWVPLQMTMRQLRDSLPVDYRRSLERLVAALAREGIVGTVPMAPQTWNDVEETGRIRDPDREEVGLTTWGLEILARLWAVGADEVALPT